MIWILCCSLILTLFLHLLWCVNLPEGMFACQGQLTELMPDITPQIQMRWRRGLGCRAGTKQRNWKRKSNPFLPLIVVENVRSLADKMDEFGVLMRLWQEYWEDIIICLSETTGTGLTSFLPSFQTIQTEGDHRQRSNNKGGGFILLVNNRWFNPESWSFWTAGCEFTCYLPVLCVT